jgi:hypothetical protein
MSSTVSARYAGDVARALVWMLGAAIGCGNGAPAVPDAFVPLDAPQRQGAGPGGGLLGQLVFGVVGDTRPVNVDDTANYPTAVVGQIWTDVQAASPHPAFAISTGDYMQASTTGWQQGPQLEAYLGTRAVFDGVVYAAMGNHECNGDTQSNCGPGTELGETRNYTEYLAKLVTPIGESRPYFVERFAATDHSWTAKLVFIAANAWSAAQGAWLDTTLGEPTTYTFVVRHEPSASFHAPGVIPSDTIIARHPHTLLIFGHTHTYEHLAGEPAIIVGNGGAPLSSDVDYGYVVVARQPSGNIAVTSYEYATNTVIDSFEVTASGQPATN